MRQQMPVCAVALKSFSQSAGGDGVGVGDDVDWLVGGGVDELVGLLVGVGDGSSDVDWLIGEGLV